MPVNVKTNDKTTNQLTKLSEKRKAEHAQNKSKQDIVAELIEAAFKKECK